MDKTKLDHFKERLEEERTRLLEELGGLGRVNPTNPDDWETTYSDKNIKIGVDTTINEPDEIDEAMEVEEYETRNAAEVPVESRFNEVKIALAKISDGTYGICTVGEPHNIEEERLEANPAAATCIKHK